MLIELLLRFAIDIAAMSFLVFGLYYQRYRDKELVVTAAMFNIFPLQYCRFYPVSNSVLQPDLDFSQFWHCLHFALNRSPKLK